MNEGAPTPKSDEREGLTVFTRSLCMLGGVPTPSLQYYQYMYYNIRIAVAYNSLLCQYILRTLSTLIIKL